jgi:sulfoxide reductase heme-binding subunit YedZ
MSAEILWYVSRAAGTASLLLLTGVVLLGALTAGRRSPHGQGATITMALHRWLSLGLLAFLGLHIGSAVVDSYVSTPVIAVLVPFADSYQRAWVGLGTIAVDLLLAVLVTSLLRHRIPERGWRWVHWATYALFPAAVVHGVAMGTADEPLLRWTSLGCGLLGAAAATWRLAATHDDRERRRELEEAGTWR